MDLQALLTECQKFGAELIPQPDGNLKIRAPRPLPNSLKDELKRRKSEVMELLTAQRPSSVSRPAKREPEAVMWPCPHCGQPATIDDVFPSLDGERRLTLWRCDPCQVVAVTPDTIRRPPVAWIRRIQQ
jgi:hypothetical protein